MSINVQGAIETPGQVAALGGAILDELVQVLPSIGLSPAAVVLIQHDPRPDGVQPALLAVLSEGRSDTQLLDMSRGGMSMLVNDVLPALAAGTTPVTSRRPAAAPNSALSTPAPAAPVHVEPVAPAAEPVPSEPAAVEPAAVEPPSPEPAPEPVAVEPEPEPAPSSGGGVERIWNAFEDAVRPQLGRGAAKAVQATKKAASGMDEAELVEFLAKRLTNFGPHIVDSFRSALG